MQYIKKAEIPAYNAVKFGELEIDTEGRIWRVAVKRTNKWNGETTLKPCIRHRVEHKAKSYMQVHLRIKGKRIHASAHRLVWMHFNGVIPDGLTINHKNGNKQDNRPENLEVVTCSENVKHAYRIGLRDENGQKNPAAKVTDAQVEEIRQIYAVEGKTQLELAKAYGVAFQTISKIVRGIHRKKQGGITADYTHRRQHAKLTRNEMGQFCCV